MKDISMNEGDEKKNVDEGDKCEEIYIKS